MNLLNMNIKVLIYPSSHEMLAEMNLDVPLIDDEPLIKLWLIDTDFDPTVVYPIRGPSFLDKNPYLE